MEVQVAVRRARKLGRRVLTTGLPPLDRPRPLSFAIWPWVLCGHRRFLLLCRGLIEKTAFIDGDVGHHARPAVC